MDKRSKIHGGPGRIDKRAKMHGGAGRDYVYEKYPRAAMQIRDHTRQRDAELGGYAPPPLEEDCPPRSNHCQHCGKSMNPLRLQMDHNHFTGAFRAWSCASCQELVHEDSVSAGNLRDLSMTPGAIAQRKYAAKNV